MDAISLLGSQKDCFSAIIKRNEPIAENIFEMWIEAPVIAMSAYCGQFVNIYLRNQAKILPRPFAICSIDHSKGWIRVVYRVGKHGTGTREITYMYPGTRVNITGPHGTTFPMSHKKCLLIGGGVGIPPLLQLAVSLVDVFGKRPDIVLGYRNDDTFLVDEFEELGTVHIATEDGSRGIKGTVMDAIAQNRVGAEIIYACGPVPMLKAVKEYALEKDLTAYISLEARMGCGLGACLSCVCKTSEVNKGTGVKNARVCKEGPVFEVREVEL